MKMPLWKYSEQDSSPVGILQEAYCLWHNLSEGGTPSWPDWRCPIPVPARGYPILTGPGRYPVLGYLPARTEVPPTYLGQGYPQKEPVTSHWGTP